MIVSKGEFIWMQEKQTTQCLRKDLNLCPVHTQLLCYNAECAHNQITTVARSLNDPPSITGRIVAQVNTTVPENLVDRELSQQCFTGIELTQPLSWMYLLEVLPLLSEGFYYYAINNFNLQRIIISVSKVLLFALPMDLIKKIGLVSQWCQGPLSIGNEMKTIS